MHFTHRSFDQSGLHREIGVIFAGKGKIQSFDHDINNGFIQRTSVAGKVRFLFENYGKSVLD